MAFPIVSNFASLNLRRIPGLNLWLKADAGISQIDSKVYQWRDLSGYQRDVIQNTDGNRPLFSPNQINGRPAIFCSTSSSGLTNSNYGGFGDNTKFTFFSVAKVSPLSAFAYEYLFTSRWAANFHASFTTAAFTMEYGTFGGPPNAYGPGDANSDNVPVLEAFTYDGTVSPTTNFYRNGVFAASSGGNPNDIITGSPASSFLIGSFGGHQYISEIIIYNRVLTTAERKIIEQYLNKKYALY